MGEDRRRRRPRSASPITRRIRSATSSTSNCRRVGATIDQFGNVGVVESVKAVSDLFTPISGEVVEINAALDGRSGGGQPRPLRRRLALQVKLTTWEKTFCADYENVASIASRTRFGRRTDLPQVELNGLRTMYAPHTERDVAQMLDAVGVGVARRVARGSRRGCAEESDRRRARAPGISIAASLRPLCEEKRGAAYRSSSARAPIGTTPRRRSRRWRCAASF